MSVGRQGRRSRPSARMLVTGAILALIVAVGFAVGGAGAARQAASPLKGLGAQGQGGIVDVSRYLGRNSRIPVQINRTQAVPMKQLVRRVEKQRARQARLDKR